MAPASEMPKSGYRQLKTVNLEMVASLTRRAKILILGYQKDSVERRDEARRVVAERPGGELVDPEGRPRRS